MKLFNFKRIKMFKMILQLLALSFTFSALAQPSLPFPFPPPIPRDPLPLPDFPEPNPVPILRCVGADPAIENLVVEGSLEKEQIVLRALVKNWGKKDFEPASSTAFVVFLADDQPIAGVELGALKVEEESSVHLNAPLNEEILAAEELQAKVYLDGEFDPFGTQGDCLPYNSSAEVKNPLNR